MIVIKTVVIDLLVEDCNRSTRFRLEARIRKIVWRAVFGGMVAK